MQGADNVNSTFADLQNEIDNDGSAVELNDTYVCEDGFESSGIAVSHNVTVNGNDFSIDAADKSTIFNVTADEATFKNIKFMNSQNAVAANGSSRLTFENCVFINSGLSLNGVTLTFNNCQFTQNSFVKAECENINFTDSQFRDLKVSDSFISLNSTDVLFSGCIFENNIAYNLSGDTLYTGGFGCLVSIVQANATFKNSRFKNNTLGTVIRASDAGSVVLDNFTFKSTDFSALMTKNGIRKNVEGNGYIISGNLDDLYIIDSNLSDIQGSASTFLINLNASGNFVVKNTDFENIGFPYGLIAVLDAKNNASRGQFIFDRCNFKNLKSECNLTYYDWNSQKGEYIWNYVCGTGKGIVSHDVNNEMESINKDAFLTGIHMDNIRGGDYLFYVCPQNLTVSDFTISDSKIGSMNGYMGQKGLVIVSYAGGNVTLCNISQDNISRCEYANISYNSIFDKYLYSEYESYAGGAGITVIANGDIDVYNISITNSVGSDRGLVILDSRGNISFNKLHMDNISGDFQVILDKYYPSLDLQTFKYVRSEDFDTGLFRITAYDGLAELTNVLVENFRGTSTGFYYKSDGAQIIGNNVFLENITFRNVTFNAVFDEMFYVDADNAAASHISFDNVNAASISNKTFFDESLEKYICDYYTYEFTSATVMFKCKNLTLLDINITNGIRNFDRLLSFDGENINVDSVIICNITEGRSVKIQYDRDLGRHIYNNWTYGGVYEGVISGEALGNLNISNVVISNCAGTYYGTLVYMDFSDSRVNLVNWTVSDYIPFEANSTQYDRDLGQYVTTRDGGNPSHMMVLHGAELLNITNFNCENISENSKILWIDAKTTYISDSTFKNMYSYVYDREFDKNTNRDVMTRESNYGCFMKVGGENLIVSNSTFADMTFSNYDNLGEGMGLMILGTLNNVFNNTRFINCTVNRGYEKTYDSDTGEYELQFASDELGAVIQITYYSTNAFSNSQFINCSALKGVICIDGKTTSVSNISNCIFKSNNASFGGAVYIKNANSVNIFGCSFVNNSAEIDGGAIYIDKNSCNVTISDVNFTENKAVYDGGAIYILANDFDLNLINSSVFLANHADHNGGAFYFNDTFNEKVFVDYRWFYRTVMFADNVELKQYNTMILNSKFENNTDYSLKIIAGGIKLSQNQTLVIEIAPDATGFVEINVTDSQGRSIVSDNYTLINGSVTLNLGVLPLGSYNVSVRYDNYSYGDNNLYLFHANSTTFRVGLMNLNANASANDTTVLENVTFEIQCPDDFKGNVSIAVDNVTVYDGPVSSAIGVGKFAAGNKTANVTFYGDGDYCNKSVEVNFTISKVDLDVNVTSEDVSTVKNATIGVNGIPQDFKGNVSVVVDNVTVYDGPVSSAIDIGKFAQGNKTADVTFYGDGHYNGKSVKVSFSVYKTLDAQDLKRGWMSPYDFRASFLDENLNPLKDSGVIFRINGKDYIARTDDDGIAYLKTSKLDVGKYDVMCINNVTHENVTASVEIVKRLIENRDFTMDFVDGTYYRVRAVGDDGNPEVKGKCVLITANTVTYKCITDKNGYAYLKINLNPRTYKVTSKYKGYKVTNKVTVKQTLKLVKKNVRVKKSAKKLVLKATVKKTNGKPLSGKKVTFKFRGKNYAVKTDKKGIAKVTLKKSVFNKLKIGKKYRFSAKVITNYVFGHIQLTR